MKSLPGSGEPIGGDFVGLSSSWLFGEVRGTTKKLKEVKTGLYKQCKLASLERRFREGFQRTEARGNGSGRELRA